MRVPLLAERSSETSAVPEPVASSDARKQCRANGQFPGKQWHTAACQKILPHIALADIGVKLGQAKLELLQALLSDEALGKGDHRRASVVASPGGSTAVLLRHRGRAALLDYCLL